MTLTKQEAEIFHVKMSYIRIHSKDNTLVKYDKD